MDRAALDAGAAGSPVIVRVSRRTRWLLLAFPELKSAKGAVRDRLEAGDADADVIATWEALVAQEISREDVDAGW